MNDPRAENESAGAVLRQNIERLLDALRRADGSEADALRAFDAGLRLHMMAEEEVLFPVLAEASADEVRALRREHAELRSLLAVAVASSDGRAVHRDVLDDLVSRLRDRAAREDGSVFRNALARPDVAERLHARLRGIEREQGALFQ